MLFRSADFVAGAEKNGMTHAEAERLFDDMGSFANYAFNLVITG